MTRRLPPLLVAVVGGIFVLLHLPVLVLVLYSFNTSRYAAGWTGFTLHWYARLLERPDILRALRLSLVVATVSTLVATALGTLVALALARRPFRGQRLVEGGLYLPIVTPEIVAGIALLILFAALRIPLGVGTVLVAHTAFSLPFVAVVVLARLRGMDRSLEEAALVLGADEATAFRRVTLPLLAPGILAGALLAFTLSLDDFLIRNREATFLLKVSAFLFLFLWVRWSLPRFRYDQIMRLGWKVMLPLALLNLIATGAMVTFL